MFDVRQFSRAFKELMPTKQAYWALQNGVKLTPPMTIFDIISDEVLGHGEYSGTAYALDEINDQDYVGTYAETREVSLRVSFYGAFDDTSYQDARYLMALFRSFKGRSALYRQGLSFAEISSLRRVNVSGDTTAYINSYFDITLRYKSINEISLDPVEEVEVGHSLTLDNNLNHPDEDLTLTGSNTYIR